LREKLAAAGLNPLAFPACYYKVEAIPKLGSGKTDFATAKKLALSCVQSSGLNGGEPDRFVSGAS
jgi:hypothetical protein